MIPYRSKNSYKFLPFHSVLTFCSHSYFTFCSILLSLSIPSFCYFSSSSFITFCSHFTSAFHSYYWLLCTGTINTICLQSLLIMSYSLFLIIPPPISYQSLILSLVHLSVYPFPLVYKTHPFHSHNPVCN